MVNQIKTIVVDECVIYKTSEVESDEGISSLHLFTTILVKCHRFVVSNRILTFYGETIKNLGKRPNAHYFVRLLRRGIYSKDKVILRSPLKVKEVLSIKDERDREFVMVALASTKKILITIDEALKRQVENVNLCKRYGLEVLSLKDAIVKLNPT